MAEDVGTRRRRLDLRPRTAFGWGKGSPIWYKFAFSVVVSAAVPLFLLVAVDRLDLALYTMAGSMQALFGHNRPYVARARLHLGLTAGQAVALVVSVALASAAPATAVLVVTGALTVTVQKLLCDAGRTGPPAQAVLSFLTLGILFGPQGGPLSQLPRDVLLYLAAAAFAALVCLAPALWSPHGPERAAVADAERATAGHEGHRAVPALNTAWDALVDAGPRSPVVLALVQRLLTAEDTFSGRPPSAPAEVDDLVRELEVRRAQRPRHPFLAALRPDSPLWGAALLCLTGCLVAGFAAYALGIDRPYWAIVTACALYRGNTTVVWQRALLRTAGTCGGVLLYAAVAPLAHLGEVSLVVLTLLAGFGIETFVSRNYAVGNLFVAPMALLLTNFPGPQATTDLIGARAADTLVGAVLGVAAAFLVTDRRSVRRVVHARDAAVEAITDTRAALHRGARGAELIAARDRLGHALGALVTASDDAAGEWHAPAVPPEEVAATVREGRELLVRTMLPTAAP
ncbi:FUSC family protein [Streptomyces sp. 7R007]